MTEKKPTKKQRVAASHSPSVRQSRGYSNPLQRVPDPKLAPRARPVSYGTPSEVPARRYRIRGYREGSGRARTQHAWRERLEGALVDEDGRRVASRGKRGRG